MDSGPHMLGEWSGTSLSTSGWEKRGDVKRSSPVNSNSLSGPESSAVCCSSRGLRNRREETGVREGCRIKSPKETEKVGKMGVVRGVGNGLLLVGGGLRFWRFLSLWNRTFLSFIIVEVVSWKLFTFLCGNSSVVFPYRRRWWKVFFYLVYDLVRMKWSVNMPLLVVDKSGGCFLKSAFRIFI